MRTHLHRIVFLAGAILLALLPGPKTGLASETSATLQNRSEVPPVSRSETLSRRASATQMTASSSDGAPFGRRSLQVGDGPLAVIWRAISVRMRADMASVAFCSQQELACSEAARNLRRIVQEARTHHGLARIGHINRAINLTNQAGRHCLLAVRPWKRCPPERVTARIIRSQSTWRCGKPVSANAM